MIIALSGKKKSGKDTVADILVKDRGFTKISFATPLKELLIETFKIDPSLLYDENKKDKELDSTIIIDYHHLDKIREVVSEEWGYQIDYATRERIEEFFDTEIETPRELMQTVGTDIIRDLISEDVFIDLMVEKLKNIQTPIVIPDARLENERNKLIEMGATMTLIKRTNIDLDEHISENDLGEEDQYDLVIENNISLTQLRSEINMWYSLVYKK